MKNIMIITISKDQYRYRHDSERCNNITISSDWNNSVVPATSTLLTNFHVQRKFNMELKSGERRHFGGKKFNSGSKPRA
jgi:hypothetical protein